MEKQLLGDYTWGDGLNAVDMNDTALRRWFQRDDKGSIKLDRAPAKGERTSFTLWDIARLAVTHDLVDLGEKVDRAFGLASFAIKAAFSPDLVSGKTKFEYLVPEDHHFCFLVVTRVAGGPLCGPRWIRLDPADPDPARKEMLLAVSDGAVVRDVHKAVSDAWYSLSDLPPVVANWLSKTNAIFKAAVEAKDA
jgi:hypothetical protein